MTQEAPVEETPIPADDVFLRCRDVVGLAGLGRSTLYSMAARGDFPAAIRIGAARSVWSRNEVLRWMEFQRRHAPRSSNKARLWVTGR